MEYQLLNFLVFGLFAVLFVVVTVSVISRLARPRVADPAEPAKGETYECGEPAIGSSWVRFDIRFYTLALVFLIFDVEVALLYPWALVFKPLREGGAGLFVFVEVLVFLAILFVGFVYCWAKGDLDWVKSVSGQKASVQGQTISERTGKATARRAAGATVAGERRGRDSGPAPGDAPAEREPAVVG